jgi:hypothetical protein
MPLCTRERRPPESAPAIGHSARMDGPSAFTVREALAKGVSVGELRSSRLAAPFHGVRSTFEPTGTRDLCRAYAAKMRPEAAFTSLSAARLWRIPLPAWVPDDTVHVSVPHGTARPGGRGVTGAVHMRGSVEIVDVDGLRVLSPADTWATLADALGLADLVAAGDYLVTPAFGSSRPALSTIDDLVDVTVRRRFRAVRLARRAARLVRVGSLSRPESLCRMLAITGGVPEPVGNLRVSPLITFDLAWEPWHLGLDYHGASHRSASQHARDVARADLARQLGWASMQVGAADLFDAPFDLLGRLRSRLVERGAPIARLDVRQVATARR